MTLGNVYFSISLTKGSETSPAAKGAMHSPEYGVTCVGGGGGNGGGGNGRGRRRGREVRLRGRERRLHGAPASYQVKCILASYKLPPT